MFIETTGLADPAPIIGTIHSNPWISDNFKIDAVVCVADAKHVKSHLDEVKPDDAVNEAVQQVIFADRILLNKCDLVTPEHLTEIKETITSINHFAEVIECTRSKIADLNRIIGINSFNVERCTELDPELFDDVKVEAAAATGGAEAEASVKKRKKVRSSTTRARMQMRLTLFFRRRTAPRPFDGVLVRHQSDGQF